MTVTTDATFTGGPHDGAVLATNTVMPDTVYMPPSPYPPSVAPSYKRFSKSGWARYDLALIVPGGPRRYVHAGFCR